MAPTGCVVLKSGCSKSMTKSVFQKLLKLLNRFEFKLFHLNHIHQSKLVLQDISFGLFVKQI